MYVHLEQVQEDIFANGERVFGRLWKLVKRIRIGESIQLGCVGDGITISKLKLFSVAAFQALWFRLDSSSLVLPPLPFFFLFSFSQQ